MIGENQLSRLDVEIRPAVVDFVWRRLNLISQPQTQRQIFRSAPGIFRKARETVEAHAESTGQIRAADGVRRSQRKIGDRRGRRCGSDLTRKLPVEVIVPAHRKRRVAIEHVTQVTASKLQRVRTFRHAEDVFVLICDRLAVFGKGRCITNSRQTANGEAWKPARFIRDVDARNTQRGGRREGHARSGEVHVPTDAAHPRFIHDI